MRTLSLDLDSLNPEQREAVEHGKGPLMIIAGAGSGKTRVLTYRIAKLIQDGVPPYRILAVTFTNKAAKEMKHRIIELVGEEGSQIVMGTFHSVCARFLRVDGHHIGIERSFVIYDDSDQISLVKDLIKQQGYDDKSIQPRGVLSEISRAKEQLISPTDYSRGAAGFFQSIVAKIYPEYNKRLSAANALDFDDILLKTVRLLEQSETVRKKYQERFLHVLIDEYQDVNYAQYRMADILADQHRNITVVGDDDQSIYAWRGADVALMMRFTSDHPDAKIVTLAQNYRSTKYILDAAYQVVKHNRSRNDKKLWTNKAEGSLIRIGETGTEQDEARAIRDTIMREVKTGRRNYSDFAILYRTNSQSRVLEEEFLRHGIPHILVGGQRFYDRKEIKDMIAYLRLALNQNDEISLRRIINTPARGIGNGTIQKAEEFARRSSISLFAALSDPSFHLILSSKASTAVRKFTRMILEAKTLAESGEVTPVLKFLLTESLYMEELRKEHSDEAEGRLENLQELVNVTTEFDNTETEPHLSAFLEVVSLISDIDAMGETGQAVTLMTLHSSKGLEFPVVFLAGMEEGIFPHSRSLGSDTELEEERRLCYVGMTRAREDLYLTFAQRRLQYGMANFNTPSRFLRDIPHEITDTMIGQGILTHRVERPAVERSRDQSYRVNELEPEAKRPVWQPPFRMGQKVVHKKFGEGIVVACNPLKNDAEVTVAFPGAIGVKKLVQSLAKLESA